MAHPNKNQKKEKFKTEDKIALVFTNEKYDKTIMDDLSEVKDDHQSMKETVQMMNIQEENTYELIDASYEQMDMVDQLVSDNIFIRTKKLTDPMGIIYPSSSLKYEKGVPWTRAKVKAMEEGAPDDYIVVSNNLFSETILLQIDFTQEEQKTI